MPRFFYSLKRMQMISRELLAWWFYHQCRCGLRVMPILIQMGLLHTAHVPRVHDIFHERLILHLHLVEAQIKVHLQGAHVRGQHEGADGWQCVGGVGEWGWEANAFGDGGQLSFGVIRRQEGLRSFGKEWSIRFFGRLHHKRVTPTHI